MEAITRKPDEEINLVGIAASLARQWPWIVGGSCAGLAFAYLNLLGSPRIWEGEFQIILSSKEKSIGNSASSLAVSSSSLASLAGLGGTGPDAELLTEVKILQSPSVLEPIFEQIKRRKAISGEPVSRMNFKLWSHQLNIKLEQGTSILNVAYRDSDKSLVLPVLSNISKAYQEYSGQDRNDSLQNGSLYLSKQLELWRAKAAASTRALDAFRLRYGIPSTGDMSSSNGVADLSALLNSVNNGAENPIKINGFTASTSSMQAIGGDPLAQLATINQELIRRRQQYTENDPSIKILIREKNALRRYIETTAGGSLALPGAKPVTQSESQSIVLRYHEMNRAASRDSSILNSMENSYLSLQLEKARAGKPWKLISTPTMHDRPVSPRPTRTLILGLIAGLVLGSGVALVMDRRSGLIFTTEDISDMIAIKLLATLRMRDSDQLHTNLVLISRGFLAGCHNLGLIPIGLSVNDPALLSVRDALQQLLPTANIELLRSLSEASRCTHQLLITSLGAATRRQLQDLQEQLKLQNQSACGWLLLDHNNAR